MNITIVKKDKKEDIDKKNLSYIKCYNCEQKDCYTIECLKN